MISANILDHFSAIEDPRQSWKTVYPLPEILLIVLCGVMAGADDFAEIARWADRKLKFLRGFLPFKDGIPSHDTLNDVMNAIPADLFSECFVSWVAALRDGYLAEQRNKRARQRTSNSFSFTSWWRERDSNPRCAHAHNGFRDRPVRPLRHPSKSFPYITKYVASHP